MAYVMVIDDDADLAGAIALVLKGDGHEVGVWPDTQQALAAMEQRTPDLAILDVMFPAGESAGFELARAMRHHKDKLRDVPVLMVTAVNSKFHLGLGSQDIDDHWLPVAEFLEKPVDFSVLRAKVVGLLGNDARIGTCPKAPAVKGQETQRR